jgi:hypothetical protein
VAVVDLRRGQVVGLLEFQTAVEEIFVVEVLPGVRFPEVLGFQQERIQHTFIVPREGQPVRTRESAQICFIKVADFLMSVRTSFGR